MRVLLTASLLSGATAVKPNIVFILTDDQDVMLNSFAPDGPLLETRKRILEEGVWFENSFAHVPICCPSRASLITGRYMHNNGAVDNGCGGQAFMDGPEKQNVFTYAQQEGYTTYYAGKYLNNYGRPDSGGLERVPPGFDSWYGLRGNSVYYNYSVSDNGVEEKHGDDFYADYYTDRLTNRSLEFLSNVSSGVFSTPFMMMISTPACHGPNDPAPQYQRSYVGKTAPRTPSWNLAPQLEKHPLMQGIVAMDQGHIDTSDVFFERRWSVLRSVDDLVVKLTDELQAMGEYDNTYIVYSSDNGYHLGQFGMLYDKRMPYEHDIRVPLLITGPGVRKNVNVSAPVMLHDLAPTFLELMGVRTPVQMDGKSWLAHVLEDGEPEHWRTDFLIEYNGPKVATKAAFRDGVARVAELSGGNGLSEAEDGAASLDTCTSDTTTETVNCKCSCRYNVSGEVQDRSPCDSDENTYKCLRTISDSEDSNYCEFDDGYVEYYDTKSDPWNLHNLALAGRTDQAKLDALSRRLYAFMLCSGESCFNPPPPPAVSVV